MLRTKRSVKLSWSAMIATNEAKAGLTFDCQSVSRGTTRWGEECDKASNYDDNIGPLHRSGNLGDRCRSSMAREQSQKCDSKACRTARKAGAILDGKNLKGCRLSCGIKPKTELTDLGPEQEPGQIVLTMPTIKTLVLQSTRKGGMDPRYLPRALPIHLFLQH
jgi:hypothetical protein